MKWTKATNGYSSGEYRASRETVYANRRPWKLALGGKLIGTFTSLDSLKRNAERHAATGRFIGGALPMEAA